MAEIKSGGKLNTAPDRSPEQDTPDRRPEQDTPVKKFSREAPDRKPDPKARTGGAEPEADVRGPRAEDCILQITGLSCGYRAAKEEAQVILENFALKIRPGEIWCILGGNGIGKTTLLSTILGTLPPLSGSILINGREMAGLPRREIARQIAYVPQYHTPPFPYTVEEIVLMGRNAYIDTFGSPKAEDRRIAEESMKNLGIEHLKDRVYTKISGGERQMVLIARAMAQRPSILMMDEPTANLDYGNQIRMLKQMKVLSEQGISVIFTSHHPEHAFLCEANVMAIRGRAAYSRGPASEIITEELLREMYGIETRVVSAESPQGETAQGVVPFL